MKRIPTIILILFLSFLFVFGGAQAYISRSYDVYTLPVMYLDEGIDETQTDDIIIAAPKLNGEEITAKPMSGAIFEFKRPGKKEDIYAERVIVQSDNTLYLSGTVIRGLCQYTETRTFTTCSDSFDFQRGNEIRLTDNHRIFNLKADTDRRNNYIGSGANVCTATQPCFIPNQVTTTERNALKNLSGAVMIWNSTLNVAQYYNPAQSQWVNFGSGAAVNASLTLSGLVGLSGTSAMLAGDGTHVSAAQGVVWTNYLTASGGLSFIDPGYVPVVDARGFLSGATLGTACAPGSGNYVLTAAQRCRPVSAIATLGSGANLMTSTGVYVEFSFTSTTYANVHGNLAKTMYMESGSLIGVGVTVPPCVPPTCAVTAGDTIEYNLSVDNNTIETNSGGIVRMRSPASNTMPGGYFTHYFVNRTTGTRTIRLMAKNVAGVTMFYTEPFRMQIWKQE